MTDIYECTDNLRFRIATCDSTSQAPTELYLAGRSDHAQQGIQQHGAQLAAGQKGTLKSGTQTRRTTEVLCIHVGTMNDRTIQSDTGRTDARGARGTGMRVTFPVMLFSNRIRQRR